MIFPETNTKNTVCYSGGRNIFCLPDTEGGRRYPRCGSRFGAKKKKA